MAPHPRPPRLSASVPGRRPPAPQRYIRFDAAHALPRALSVSSTPGWRGSM